MTLTEFLLARIAEREAAVEVAYARGLAFTAATPGEMLAECEMRRQVVEIHRPAADEVGVLFCGTCHDNESPYGVRWPCNTMTALAMLHADHPDYLEEWKP